MTKTATTRREADIATACKIDGWLTRGEASVLYDLARNADGPIIEIGSWQGRSTAALALGSAAGRSQPVYAVDPFIGPQMKARITSLDNHPDGIACSPERLRANLNAAGVNGQVTIVPKTSQDALADVPQECALLFIDGDHTFDAVCRDFDLYLPRLKMGGFAVIHDVVPGDQGVVDAFDARIASQPLRWRMLERVDSAMVIQRVRVESRRVMLACPGRSFGWGTLEGIVQASLEAHHVRLANNGNGFDDFNSLWAQGLNAAENGDIDLFAMLHSDIVPDPGCVDMLVGELEDLGADLVSTAIPLKDGRGLTSCGIGDVTDPWGGAFRRFTVRETLAMPATFCLADTPHPDKFLLHNTGCWVADLRRPVFRAVKPDGSLKCSFDFPTRIARAADGKWAAQRESEDWFFSRQLHDLGARTFITRKVRLRHRGDADYVNFEPWGTFENGDDDTRKRWDPQTSPAETQCLTL